MEKLVEQLEILAARRDYLSYRHRLLLLRELTALREKERALRSVGGSSAGSSGSHEMDGFDNAPMSQAAQDEASVL